MTDNSKLENTISKVKSFKSYRRIFTIIIGGLIIAALYFAFYKSDSYQVFLEWTKSNIELYFVTIVIMKILGIIIPVIPGGVFTISAIPILGIKAAFFADALGSFIGAISAYFLGLKYGFDVLEKLFDKAFLEKIKKVKIKETKQLEAMVILRIVFMEGILYTAGILKVRLTSFIIGSTLGHIISALPVFLLAEGLITTSNATATVLKSLVYISLLVFILMYRKRYLEENIEKLN